MAASSRNPRSGSVRKFWLLGTGVVAAVALYTAGWFYAANQLQSRLATVLGQDHANGVSVDCPDMEFRGYPFRIGLFCSKVTVDDGPNGISATFGPLRSAAQVYAPWRAVWEMDGPAEVRAAPGLTVSADWDRLQSSLRAGFGGIDQTSLLVEGVTASLISAFTTPKLDLNVKRGEVHLRRNGADMDAALLFEAANARIEDDPRQLPTLSGSADLTLVDKAEFMSGRDETGTGPYGMKGEMRRLVVDLGDGRIVTVSGPFSINDQGLISGKFHVEIEKIKGWQDAIAAAFPEGEKNVKLASSLLKSLASGKDDVSVDLKVTDGVVTLSFIPIGFIPPI